MGSKLPGLLTPEQIADVPYAMIVILNPLLSIVDASMSIGSVENGAFGIACNADGFTKDIAQMASPNATFEEINGLTCFERNLKYDN